MDETALILGGVNARTIPNPEELLLAYRNEIGGDYYDYQPVTQRDMLVPEDLAVTLAFNSNVSWRAFRSMKNHAADVELSKLPDKPLHNTISTERDLIANVIVALIEWPGFGSSVATKVLHKKRPELIPVLDNQSIYSAYLNPQWPAEHIKPYTVYSYALIREALENVFLDVSRAENLPIWEKLRRLEPAFSRIELFDCVWFMYFLANQQRLR
ncbi:MAG: hypothetical protein KF698_04220 [Anaerolineales bacterium]|nr:hypothetical protein [Anaerolineales bacterium]